MVKSDNELKLEGYDILSKTLGLVDAERFVVLIQREKFDYTKWREHLLDGVSGEEISQRAMGYLKDKGEK